MDTDSINELKNLVKKFCDDRDWDQFHSLKELAIGVSSEAGELLQLLRFQNDAQIKAQLDNVHQKEAIADELSDILFFILRIGQMYDIDLSESLQSKLQKNAHKYPIEKSRGKNTKYNDL